MKVELTEEEWTRVLNLMANGGTYAQSSLLIEKVVGQLNPQRAAMPTRPMPQPATESPLQ